ncbi:DNA-binding response regulator [Marivirga lumbricoides]|uniref:DNA-binding response regulator n=1 Tax=Marivirga lumbricoides TaxID=1046115 RepID=A0A2T4DJ61_9BACT|nr:DNA-binding response regulator [Marivirga lumbricoides]
MEDILVKKADSIQLKCLVVDDEAIAIRGIVNYINKMDTLKVVATCSSAIEAAKILKTQEIDLMFLDINMPHLSGMEFLESLEKPPLTIITTAYSEYALEGFRLHVVDYLMKPISFQRFFQAVSKAQGLFRSSLVEVEKATADVPAHMYIRQGDAFHRVLLNDVLYIESMQNYAKLFLRGKVLTIHQTMVSLEDLLPKEMFFRIHRSYLINLSKIDIISGGRIFIQDKELPISRHRREALLTNVVYKNLMSK